MSYALTWPVLCLLQVESDDMADTRMDLGQSRQGHPTSTEANWRDKSLSPFNLPHTIQMGEEYAFKRESNEMVRCETLWQNEITRQLIKALQRKAYRIAMRCMNVIGENADALVSSKVRGVINPLSNGE